MQWDAQRIFSCAYRASGNGIIKYTHRTIKRMAAQNGSSMDNMMLW